MHVRYFAPAPALRPYVRCYYLLAGDFGARTSDVFFADGCPELVVNAGVDFYRDGAREAPAKVIGQITRPLHVEAAGRGFSFGVWFEPHGLAAFTGVPAGELTDAAVAADELFGASLGEVIGEGLAAKPDAGLAARVDALLGARLRLRHRHAGQGAELVNFAVRRLNGDRSPARISELARACGVSPRYLQQLFRERVGLRPKQYQRIARFQASIEGLAAGRHASLTDAAYGAGYFDQAHFIREFRGFTGVTPSRYRREDHPIGRHF